MYRLRRAAIFSSCIGGVILTLWLLPLLLNPTPPTPEQRRLDQAWVQTSPYWLDRQACRVLGLCGTHHLRRDPAERPLRNPGNGSGSNPDDTDDGELRLELRSLSSPVDRHQWRVRESLGEESWEIADTASTFAKSKRSQTQPQQHRHRERTARPASGADTERAIPDYVLAYAPLVHLYSDEHFWPSHIGEHLEHMKAFCNGTPISDPNLHLSLDGLADLNAKTSKVFLTSIDNVEDRPEWLHSHANRPAPFTDPGQGDDSAPSHTGEHTIRRPFADDTTWFSVDRDHPLHRLSDPRKIERLDKHPRRWGPEEMQSRRDRARSTAEELEQKPMGDASDSSALASASGSESAEPAGSATPPPPSHGHKPDDSGYSKAPAILVMVDKGSGILDAFWFFFYSYNLGQTVLGVRYGNHVGDWEHCMIRFEDGVPRALFMSEHEGGQAYAWSALEKLKPGNHSDGIPDGATGAVPPRPVLYSAVGSHAMYAVPGTHPYVLPFEMLRDETDKGPLWDPAKNNLAYFYDYASDDDSGEIEDSGNDTEEDSPSLRSLTPASSNPDAPTSWFHFKGPWGDELYNLGDERQWRLFGQYHYITGPVGPKFKNLQRRKVCQRDRCRLLYSLDESGTWY